MAITKAQREVLLALSEGQKISQHWMRGSSYKNRVTNKSYRNVTIRALINAGLVWEDRRDDWISLNIATPGLESIPHAKAISKAISAENDFFKADEMRVNKTPLGNRTMAEQNDIVASEGEL